MIEAKIQLQDQEVKAALERLRLAMRGKLGEPMREIGRLLKTSTQLRFRDGVSPDGLPWKPSWRVIEHGGQTGRLSGRLHNSLTYRATDSSVEVGTNVVYGPAFQFGKSGSEQVKAHTRRVTMVFGRRPKHPATASVRAFSRRVSQPARAFVGVSNQDREDMLDVVDRHLFKSIGVDYFR